MRRCGPPAGQTIACRQRGNVCIWFCRLLMHRCGPPAGHSITRRQHEGRAVHILHTTFIPCFLHPHCPHAQFCTHLTSCWLQGQPTSYLPHTFHVHTFHSHTSTPSTSHTLTSCWLQGKPTFFISAAVMWLLSNRRMYLQHGKQGAPRCVTLRVISSVENYVVKLLKP